MNSGKAERLPYSFSRWTDVPAAKWAWFERQLSEGHFIGFDPRTAMPGEWSLKPEDTFGLIFWTKDPTNILASAELLKAYPLVVHLTLTAWQEVEKGAPDLVKGMQLMRQLVDTFGPDQVVWRFSPVPLLDDVLDRFAMMAGGAATLGIKEVFVSFLQENDLLPETRSPRVRLELLKQMAARASGLKVKLCAEDRLLAREQHLPKNLQSDICESGGRFMAYAIDQPKTEGCGCALAVDPFTINESCTLGCAYCYAADQALAPRKRNTTKKRKLVVVK